MKLYPRLALSGIRKNRKLYVPYILSCIGTVMMYFILHSLSISPLLQETRGGGNLSIILSLGKFVIAAFSLLFLFYTNSFLIRRRYKEFGLYNILGMDKHGIGRVVFWESLFVSLIGLSAGLLFGMAFSKLAEFGLLRTIQSDVDFRFYISWETIVWTLLIYGGIFLLLLVKSRWQVGRAKPLELMKSENFGERPPRANWLLALLGLGILIAAYYISVSIHSPLKALMLFFVAVLMVIAATYLLFMAGSVTLCRLLQKNKKYYYQKSHFVSVSSMAYRMKRNGAGLASICILSTMVLVMLSSSASLYFGKNDALSARFPQGNIISLSLPELTDTDEAHLSQLREVYEGAFSEFGIEPQNVTDLPCANLTALQKNGVFLTGQSVEDVYASADKVISFNFMSAADYNRITGSNITVAPGQALAYENGFVPTDGEIRFETASWKVTGTVPGNPIGLSTALAQRQDCTLVISDLNELQPLAALTNNFGGSVLTAIYYYGYDVDVDIDTAVELYNTQTGNLSQIIFLGDNGFGYSGGCRAAEQYDFLSTYAGLFFIGICLSIVFLFAAAMIIYYKQVSEGYEDQSRFAIMQKVGMTKKDIKKSINSQVLTVFFAPLLFAGLHLAFAVPLVWRILQLFGLANFSFMVLVTAIAFVLFGIFYAVIYKLTARAYYSIVSADE